MFGTVEKEGDTPELCAECHKPLQVGDKVMFTRPRTAIYRIWHTDCFNGSLTPFDQWPKDFHKPDGK
jgi:hypothetical protein